jgi:hypothetical protein
VVGCIFDQPLFRLDNQRVKGKFIKRCRGGFGWVAQPIPLKRCLIRAAWPDIKLNLTADVDRPRGRKFTPKQFMEKICEEEQNRQT